MRRLIRVNEIGGILVRVVESRGILVVFLIFVVVGRTGVYGIFVRLLILPKQNIEALGEAAARTFSMAEETLEGF